MNSVRARFEFAGGADAGEVFQLLVSDLRGAVVRAMGLDGTRALHVAGGNVVDVVELPPDRTGHRRVEVAIPAEWIARGGVTALITILVANTLEFGDLKLQAIEVPGGVFPRATGPRLGTRGVRKVLRHAHGPLFGVPIKPNIGLTLQEKMDVAEALAAAGVDLVKDDETFFAEPQEIAEHSASIQRCMDKYQTPSRRSCYIPNVSGTTITDDHISLLATRGVRGIMVCFLVSGWSRTVQLSERHGGSMIVYGHRALHEALEPYVSMRVLALLARLSGVDVVHVGTPQPVRPRELDEAKLAVGVLTSDRSDMNATLPVFSKTTGPLGRWLVGEFGEDVVVMACGEIYRDRDLRRAASRWIEEVRGGVS